MSDELRTARLSRISAYARVELILLALTSVPNIFVFLVIPHSRQALAEHMLADGGPDFLELLIDLTMLFSGLAVILVLLGLAFDAVRGRTAPAGISPPSALSGALKERLSELLGSKLGSKVASHVLVAPRDLTLGAHVRGIGRQRIVISGGMITAVFAGDVRALAILCHEYGHISNWDKFLPGIVVYSFLNAGLYLFLFGRVGIGIAILIYAVTTYVCRRREFAADAFSAAMTGSKDPLVQTLASVGADPGTTFFHPSLADRKKAVENKFPITKVSWFYIFVWTMLLLIGVIGYRLVAISTITLNPVFTGLFLNFDLQMLSTVLPYYDMAAVFLSLTAIAGLLAELTKKVVRVR